MTYRYLGIRGWARQFTAAELGTVAIYGTEHYVDNANYRTRTIPPSPRDKPPKGTPYCI